MEKLEKCARLNGFCFNKDKRNTNFVFENLKATCEENIVWIGK